MRLDILDAARSIKDMKASTGGKWPPAKDVHRLFTKAADLVSGERRGHPLDRIYISSLGFLCPREFVLNYWKPADQVPAPYSNQLMMAGGTLMHEFLQNEVLGPLGILFGTWSTGGTHLPHRLMPTDLYPRPTYVEERVYDKGLRLSGKMDGIVCRKRLEMLVGEMNKRLPLSTVLEEMRGLAHDHSLDDPAVLEIKTAGKRVLDRVMEGGLPDYYRMQATAYCYIKGLPHAVFMFLDRDSCSVRAVIPYRREEALWNEIQEKCLTVWDAIKHETLPERFMACTHPGASRAKSCPHKEPCWLYIDGTLASTMKAADRFKLYVDRCKKEQPERKWLTFD